LAGERELGRQLGDKREGRTGARGGPKKKLRKEQGIVVVIGLANGHLFSYSGTMDKRILIADDEGINRLFVKTVLLQDGWTVAEAVNGREAVDLAGKEDFDIILLDIKMPVMDGREAVRRIRQLKQYSRGTSLTPILGLTAYSDDIIYRELEEDGMDGLIVKPVTEKSLLSQLDSFLSK